MAMKRVDISKKGDKWVAESGGKPYTPPKATKDEIVKSTAATAKRDSDPVSVRIHNMNGRIGEERTYPRSADPKRSKG